MRLKESLDTLQRVYDTMPNGTNRIFVKSAMDDIVKAMELLKS